MKKDKKQKKEQPYDSRINVKLRTDEERAAYTLIKQYAVGLRIPLKTFLLEAGLDAVKRKWTPHSK